MSGYKMLLDFFIEPILMLIVFHPKIQLSRKAGFFGSSLGCLLLVLPEFQVEFLNGALHSSLQSCHHLHNSVRLGIDS